MKNILIFSVFEDTIAIENAIKYINDNDNVIFLQCDASLGCCIRNPLGSKVQCMLCKHVMNRIIKEKKIKALYISDFIDNGIIKLAEEQIFNYSDTKSLKKLSFHGVEIGYGAFSTYATLTRHANPLYNNNVKNYINHLLKMQVVLTLVIEKILSSHNINLIIFHNGRFAQFKPLLNIAQNRGIDYIATEVVNSQDGVVFENSFFNDIPHSITAYKEKIIENWNNADVNKREYIGKLFFENKKKSLYAGDKIYTKSQKLGKLPDNWDSTKENIVIFNSSEDEFLSISSEYDSDRLFESQYKALINIFDTYKYDSTKHFYLRIHPNLKNVDDISHLALNTLDYPNVTIISAKSDISSYSLIENAQKIIVFSSTIGIESSYWGKPVIVLDKTFYSTFQVAYYPKTEKELYGFINNKKLEPIVCDDIIKIGFFLMHPKVDQLKYIHVKWSSMKIPFLNKVVDYTNVYKFLGSSIIFEVLFRILSRFPLYKSFKRIPKDRDLWNINIKD